MDWRGRQNATTVEDFLDLWQAEQDAFAALGQLQGATRSAVAALALLAWDILTTLDDEVNLIWPSAWTPPKALYLFVRYYSLIALILHVSDINGALPCVPWLIFEIMSTFTVETAVEVIMILRIRAIYAAKRRVQRYMWVGFAVQVALMAVSLGVSIPQVVTGFYCKAADVPVMMVLYSSASIAYETYLFGLMMVGVLRSGKDGYGSSETLLDILIRDGTLGFLGVFMSMLLNTILFTAAPTTLVTLGFPWLLSILGVTGPRLILNLRSQHARNLTGPSSLGDFEFAAVPKYSYSAVRGEDHVAPSISPSTSTPTSASAMDDSPDTDDYEEAVLNPSSSHANTPTSRAPSGSRRQSTTPSLARTLRRMTGDSARSFALPLPFSRERHPHVRIPDDDDDVGGGGGVLYASPEPSPRSPLPPDPAGPRRLSLR